MVVSSPCHILHNERREYHIPVSLQDLKGVCKDGRSNSISVIQQEKELTVSHIRRQSIALISQEMETKGGDIISNFIPVIQQEIETNGDEIGKNSLSVVPQEMQSDSDDCKNIMIPKEVESKADESDDITNSIQALPQDVESNVEESNDDISTNSNPVIPQEMELEGSDIGRNSISETPQEIELDGDDIRRTSIGEIDPADILTHSVPVILQEMDSNDGDLRRDSIACIPQEVEPEDGDIRRNSIIVIPAGIEANGADVRRRSIARNIQSRYLRASMGSCHDYCKYGGKAFPKAERKRTSTINCKPSPDSFISEKKVISVTKKGTPLKKVSSHSKEVDVPTEESIHSRGKCGQFEPSSKVKSPVSYKPSPDSEAQIHDKSFVTEKEVISVTMKRTVSLEKDTDVTMEDLLDLEEETEKSEPSPLTGSMNSMRNSKVVSSISSKPSQDSKTRKINNSAVVEKKALSMKKKGTSSSKNEFSSFEHMEEQGSCRKGNTGTRKSKEGPDSSSSGGHRSIRNHNKRASLSGEKRTMGLQTVSLSSRNFCKGDSNVNTGSSYNLKGLSNHSHVKDQNDPGVEPEPASGKDMPEKILYVIESNTQNNTVESTLDGVSVPKSSPSSPESVDGKSKKFEHARRGIGRTGSSPSSEKNSLRPVNGAHSQSAGSIDQDNKGLRRPWRGNQASLSPSSSSSSMSIFLFESTHDKLNGANSQHGISKTVKAVGKSKVQHKTTPRKSAIVGSGNQNSVPLKLAFRRGRVIELQPENSTPRRLKFRRASLAVEVQNSKGSKGTEKKEVDDSQSTGAGNIKRGSNVRKEVGNRQPNGAAIINRVSLLRKEVGDRGSNGVATKRAIIGKKGVDDNQTNGAGVKRVSILKKKVGDRQPKGAIKRGITRSKEVDGYQTNSAKIKSEKVVLRNQEQVEVSPRKSLRRNRVSVSLLNGTRSNPEKVVLRHQDVKGKKDDQKLLNNVIEETASKLVETRKSKVKALVGAFESVISLQDTRPAATTGAH